MNLFKALKVRYTASRGASPRYKTDIHENTGQWVSVFDGYYPGRPGNDEIQLALFRDYINNTPFYNEWHAVIYFGNK